jgi:hypothetical protein
MSVLAEDLIASSKLRSFAPTSQSTFQTADFLVMANEEMLLKLVADIFTKREDFFLTTKDVAITAGVDRVTIPKRAIGGTFKSLWYTENGIIRHRLTLATEDDIENYSGTTGAPSRFHIEGDEVVLLPTPISSGYARFRYWAKPNLLTSTENCAKITSISSAGGTTTFNVDTDLTEDLSIGSQVDFLSAKSPFLLWAEEVSITSISSTQIQVATSDVDNAAGNVEPIVGDYICPAGYANIPMLPYEFHPVLAQMMAVRQLAGLGHIDKWNVAKAELKEVRDEAESLIKNRVETSPKVISPARNGLVRTFGRR